MPKLKDIMADEVSRGALAGFVGVIATPDKVHVELGGKRDLVSGAPMTRDTIFRIASMTKPVTALAAMMLVERGMLKLDEPVTGILPELKNRRVLRSLDADITDTVPARRDLTLRDLLTFRAGIGLTMTPPGTYKIQKVLSELELMPGANPPDISPDEWLRRFASVPLMAQPGERWMYHTSADVLAVLIARASDTELSAFFKANIFDPLRMHDTGFAVASADLPRLATCYERDVSGKLFVSSYGRARSQPAGGTGLFSTADDYLSFARAWMEGGAGLVAPATIAEMTRDHLSPDEKLLSPFAPGFWETNGWGYGVSVVSSGPDKGMYGWDGGFGTSWRNDPERKVISLFFMQRMMLAPDDTEISLRFREQGTAEYAVCDP